ncbi:uncharacterized protein MKK02DRAFT_18347 [Dioszegia hungarica]|uniref:Ion transport domain-containing protein n=1 Tax=Dioszegia hungarica TaxID=4972 RepID=A0AA38H5Z0_9TREE|nr:uncharacterized protein MKK02DRAFT_18347 [Dioszegia hungarica]KAI9633386.1 hypothetical protein MKK02DRAFT_18347 [Dioszegia hungarica]
MSRPDNSLTPASFELPDDIDDEPTTSFLSVNNGNPNQPQPSRSPYHLPTSEKLRGLANRIIFSRYYVLFYFVMMSLSMVTVVMSLMARRELSILLDLIPHVRLPLCAAAQADGCPSITWHILEIVINALMVIEVGTRWIAYGKKYPMTPLNVIDLLLVLFCSITLIVVFTSPCSDSSMSEENLDMILLVIRNGVQFLRIVNILRRSGHSIFNPPKPIDLSQARPDALDMDLDFSDEEAAAERTLDSRSAPILPLHSNGRRTLAGGGRYEPLYADEPDRDRGSRGSSGDREQPARQGVTVRPGQGREELTEEDQDAWDRLG